MSSVIKSKLNPLIRRRIACIATSIRTLLTESVTVTAIPEAISAESYLQGSNQELHVQLDPVTGANTVEVLPFFPTDYTVHYLINEASVNAALSHIVDGVVGFDTESVPRRLTAEEQVIDDMIELVGGSRKSAILAWQMIQLKSPDKYPYSWSTMGLCVIQISTGRDVWIIHLRQIKALPSELRRILTSPDIVKVGVGLISDITTVWYDLRIDLANLLDVGMMARLLLARQFSSGAYQNLSMQTTSEQILGYRVDKQEQVSDWSKALEPSQIQYAGADAILALRLFEKLVPRLQDEAQRLNRIIPDAWYSFNSRMGEPTRIQRTIRNEVVAWSVKDCPWFFAGKFQGYFP